MKLSLPVQALGLVSLVSTGRVASGFTSSGARSLVRRPGKSALAFGVDPSSFLDLSHQLGSSFQDALPFFTLAEGDALLSSVDPVVLQQAVDGAAVQEAVSTDYGWFGFLTVPVEILLQSIHTALVAIGLSTNTWGVSIIVLTVLIKILTYPLTKSQLESTNKMQAMQPAIKDLQAKYQSNPEVMNQKIAEFYQTNDINPLAGCFPALVQIPVFIGLYRAVLELAQNNELDERFLWLPNLEGPTFGADPAHGTDWLLTGWVDGVPSMGWDDTSAFLILPALLVVSQYASMQLMQPPNQSQQPGNAILQILPLMIGWFALNVPSALCLYWMTNNIVTTATSLFIRNTMPVTVPVTAGTSASLSPSSAQTTIFAPPREKPAGFASAPATRDTSVRPITAIDAEVIVKEVGPKDAPVKEVTAPPPKPVESKGSSDSSTKDKPKEGEGKRKRKKRKS